METTLNYYIFGALERKIKASAFYQIPVILLYKVWNLTTIETASLCNVTITRACWGVCLPTYVGKRHSHCFTVNPRTWPGSTTHPIIPVPKPKLWWDQCYLAYTPRSMSKPENRSGCMFRAALNQSLCLISGFQYVLRGMEWVGHDS